MTWVALDDQIFLNKKIVRCDSSTKLLYVVGLVYCGNQLTDGFIPMDTLPLLAGMAGIDLANAKQNVSKLCSTGLWDAIDDMWHIPDYLEYNPSREQVLHKKAVRKAAGKMGGLANAQAKAKQNASKNVAPSPSPSPYDDEREDDDIPLSSDAFVQARTALEALGLWTKTDRDRFADMWPELVGREDWVGRAITIARTNAKGGQLKYALKVLANAIHTGVAPGATNNGTTNGKAERDMTFEELRVKHATDTVEFSPYADIVAAALAEMAGATDA